MLTREDRQFITDTVAETVDRAFAQRTANFATKDDLKSFATKDDLADMEKEVKGIRAELTNFATKDDLKNFATKDDLKAFATKNDLAGMEKRIRKNIHEEVEGLAIKTHDEFGKVHDSLAATNRKLDGVAATTREHEYHIRKFSVDIDQLKQRTGLTD